MTVTITMRFLCVLGSWNRLDAAVSLRDAALRRLGSSALSDPLTLARLRIQKASHGGQQWFLLVPLCDSISTLAAKLSVANDPEVCEVATAACTAAIKLAAMQSDRPAAALPGHLQDCARCVKSIGSRGITNAMHSNMSVLRDLQRRLIKLVITELRRSVDGGNMAPSAVFRTVDFCLMPFSSGSEFVKDLEKERVALLGTFDDYLSGRMPTEDAERREMTLKHGINIISQLIRMKENRTLIFLAPFVRLQLTDSSLAVPAQYLVRVLASITLLPPAAFNDATSCVIQVPDVASAPKPEATIEGLSALLDDEPLTSIPAPSESTAAEGFPRNRPAVDPDIMTQLATVAIKRLMAVAQTDETGQLRLEALQMVYRLCQKKMDWKYGRIVTAVLIKWIIGDGIHERVPSISAKTATSEKEIMDFERIVSTAQQSGAPLWSLADKDVRKLAFIMARAPLGERPQERAIRCYCIFLKRQGKLNPVEEEKIQLSLSILRNGLLKRNAGRPRSNRRNSQAAESTLNVRQVPPGAKTFNVEMSRPDHFTSWPLRCLADLTVQVKSVQGVTNLPSKEARNRSSALVLVTLNGTPVSDGEAVRQKLMGLTTASLMLAEVPQ